MKTQFSRSFERDLRRLQDRGLYQRIHEVVQQIQEAGSLEDLSHLKKLRGSEAYYRIRIGDYRLGIKLEDGEVVCMRILHRKDIYRYFP